MGNSLATLTYPTVFIDRKDVRNAYVWAAATAVVYPLTVLALVLGSFSGNIMGVILTVLAGLTFFASMYISGVVKDEKKIRRIARKVSRYHVKAVLNNEAVPPMSALLARNGHFDEQRVAAMSTAQLDLIDNIYQEEFDSEVAHRKETAMRTRREELAAEVEREKSERNLNRLSSIGADERKVKQFQEAEDARHQLVTGEESIPEMKRRLRRENPEIMEYLANFRSRHEPDPVEELMSQMDENTNW